MGHVTWVMTGLVTNVTPSLGPQVLQTNSFIQSAYSLPVTIMEHFTLLTSVIICLPLNLLAATFAMMMTWAAAPWL